MDDHVSQIIRQCHALLALDTDRLTGEQRANVTIMLDYMQTFAALRETQSSDHLIHDLRRPLTVIHSFCYLLLTEAWGPITSTQATRLEHIQRANQALIDDVNQMAASASV